MKIEQAGELVLTKPKRPYKPKVRTGCITCKIRRVKCDEVKPACLRCISTGRNCDGFAPLKVLMFEICQDDRERRSFHYFRERTTLEICTNDASQFWTRLVLQAGYAREPVRHALVAMGSFHESLENKQTMQRISQFQFTLEQYNKSISALTNDVESLSIEEILISCIIFIFFENVQGHFDTALKHLENGLNILSEWRVKRQNGAVENSSMIEIELASILDTLHVQASVLLPHSRSKVRNEYDDILPTSFTSLQESHHYFYRLVHWVCKNLEVAIEKENPMDIRDSFIAPRCATRFVQWYSLLEREIVSSAKNLEASLQERTAERLGVLHMKIQYHIVIIMLRCLPFKDEMIFDQQLPHFEAILTLAKDFFENSATLGFDFPRAVESTGFAFSIMPCLSMLVCRCRDPFLRREALDLLRSAHWREDIWDSSDASSVAEQIMIAEENGRDVKTCADVLDVNRLHLVGCTPFAYSRKLQVLELQPHYTFDHEWIKLTCVRSGWEEGRERVKEIWLNRHGDASLASKPGFFPKDVDGLFPQVIHDDSRLFSLLDTRNAARFIGRFHANDMFAADHTGATGRQGDLVTLSDEFTEYLATEKHSYQLH